MRQILFRGKTLDNGEWVYGSLFGKRHIAVEIREGEEPVSSFGVATYRWVEVIPETVGQYTGLDDKNGVKIFDGDILLEKDAGVWEKFTKADGSEWSKFAGKREDKKYTVFFDEKKAQFTTEGCWLWALVKLVKVIGNIHDNPELVEE